MAEIHRGQVSTKIVKAAGLQPGADAIPKRLADVVMPVLIVNEDIEKHIVASNNRSTTTAGSTQFTVPVAAIGRFFLTSLTMNNQSDATADNTLIRLQGQPKDSGTVGLIEVGKLTTTAGTRDIVKEFNPPLELEPGSTIVLINAFTTGGSTTQTQIVGHTLAPFRF